MSATAFSPAVKSIMVFSALILVCAGTIVTLKVHPLGILLLVAAGWLFGAAMHSATLVKHTLSDGTVIYLEPWRCHG